MTEHIQVHMIQLMQKYTQHNIKKHLQDNIQNSMLVLMIQTMQNNMLVNTQKHT